MKDWKKIVEKAVLGGVQAGLAGLSITGLSSKALIPAIVGFVIRFGLAFFNELNKEYTSVKSGKKEKFFKRLLELC